MLAKDRQKMSKAHPMDIARRVLLRYFASKQRFVLISWDSSSDAVVASLTVLSPKRERPHHLHDRWHVWHVSHLRNKVGISFSKRWPLPSGQLGVWDECEIAYCLDMFGIFWNTVDWVMLNFTGSLDCAAVFAPPPQHLVHRHSGHVASPGPSSARRWCLGLERQKLRRKTWEWLVGGHGDYGVWT